MRSLVIALIWVTTAVLAEEPAVSEAPAAARDAAAAEAAVEQPEVKIPPGFRKKQRGKHTVYCRKEEVMGTRFRQEKCYDEQGLKELELALEESRERVDQLRRICSSQKYCGAG